MLLAHELDFMSCVGFILGVGLVKECQDKII